MAKLVASEYTSKAADLGIQMLGGMGYAMETNMQRYWRDARIYRIATVTNEMAKDIIARQVGLPRTY
jgi:alkylation response protein AidB-like acyl-CoA dehydrogenase